MSHDLMQIRDRLDRSNELPSRLQALDRRVVSFPGAVRGEMAASIPRISAFELWMTSPKAGCRFFSLPGGPDRQDGGAGRQDSRSGTPDDRSGRQKNRGNAGWPLGNA